jgi:hypothetical protein
LEKFIIQENNNNFLDSKNNENNECFICLGDLTKFYNLACGHKYCSECLSYYLKNRFNNSEVEFIKCPSDEINCQNISDSIIKELVSNEDYEKYLKFLNREKIKKNSKLIFCPFPDCESYAEFPIEIIKEIKRDLDIGKNMRNDSDYISEKILANSSFVDESKFETYDEEELTIDQKKALSLKKINLECQNGHVFCNLCKEKDHGNNKCADFIEKEFGNIIKKKNNKNIKKCPRCNFYIEKNQGCNHMTCPNKECNYEFCWICMGSYSNNHYRRVGTRCFNQMYLNQDSIFMRFPCMIHLKNLIILILIIILIPIALSLGILAGIFTYPILIFGTIEKNHLKYLPMGNLSSKFLKIISFFTILFLSISLLPFILMANCLSIIGLIFFGFYKLKKCLCG